MSQPLRKWSMYRKSDTVAAQKFTSTVKPLELLNIFNRESDSMESIVIDMFNFVSEHYKGTDVCEAAYIQIKLMQKWAKGGNSFEMEYIPLLALMEAMAPYLSDERRKEIKRYIDSDEDLSDVFWQSSQLRDFKREINIEHDHGGKSKYMIGSDAHESFERYFNATLIRNFLDGKNILWELRLLLIASYVWRKLFNPHEGKPDAMVGFLNEVRYQLEELKKRSTNYF